MKFLRSLFQAGLLLFLPLAAFFLFYYPFSFNYRVEDDYHLLLYGINPLLLVAAGGLLSGTKKKTNPHAEIIYVAACVLFSIRLLMPIQFGISNEHVTVLQSMLLVYFFCCCFFTVTNIEVFLLVMFIAFMIELVIGIWQISMNGAGERKLFVQGTLHNSGIYSCYLVVNIPLVFYFISRLQLKKPVPFILQAITLSVVFLIIYCTLSRTALMAGVTVSALLLYFEHRALFKRNRIITINILALSGLAFLFITAYLIKIKPASGAGRLLMLRTGWAHLFDHFLFGIGPGRMNMYYPVWQAQYFENNATPALSDFFNAGETYLLFNEYLQLFEEVGLAGFACFVFLLIDFFRSSSSSHKALLTCVKITVIAILLCAFTSYPLHVNMLLLILVTCLVVAYKIRDQSRRKNWLLIPTTMRKLIVGLSMCMILITGIPVMQQSIAAYKWVQLREDQDMPGGTKTHQYQQLSTKIGHYGKFLVTYGEQLMQDTSNAAQAAAVLEKSKASFISFRTYWSCAQAYAYTGNYQQAIENYRFLSFYTPARFRPKYELIKLYHANGDYTNACKTGEAILTMPVKKTSSEVLNIKNEVKCLLRDLSCKP